MQNNAKAEITKHILADSLKKLLVNKTLDKISIREIVGESGLNRQTFYYHFKDIYHLVEWIFQKEALAIFNDLEGEELWQEGLLKLLKYIDQNRIVCKNIINSLGHESILKYFYDDIYVIIKKAILSFTEGLNIKKNYSDLLTHYYILSFGSVVENWTLGGINQSPEELIEFLDQILQDQMKGTYVRLLEDNEKL
ncbi:TetR/AcrR family transcriptional regulator C-terminal domain-containing protein [Brassicibacter mesophilus]|uniref:TetR/AcrR family transcriptional regulator C-terminal domain-containing protein n=1 Tax=Brassicibacter mesophilus TaxID=745119 RepID=UPI003D20AFF6